MKRHGQYSDQDHERDHQQAVDEFNRWSGPITFTVTLAGTEVAVAHRCSGVPTIALQVAAPGTVTATGVVSIGTTAWTNNNAYLTATETGTYAVMFRR